MKIVNAPDIFTIAQTNDAICITTNGIVKKDGTAVMGKGIALYANNRFKVSTLLGQRITQYGNNVFDLGVHLNYGHLVRLFSFPTKHDWRNGSDIELIKRSAIQLIMECDKHNIKTCYLPPAGCGCGGLHWDTQVKPILSKILDDRFVIVLS